MSAPAFIPPLADTGCAVERLRAQAYAVLRPASTIEVAGVSGRSLDALASSWHDLPPDAYLKDAGRYRRRRHSCFVEEDGRLARVPHRAHWQPLEYNALHGGMQRWFEPVDDAVAVSEAWTRLILGLGNLFDQVRPAPRWSIEAHQFRIDTAEGIGRPTPEGAHRDGVDFVAVVLVARRGLKGGETRVFDAHGPAGQRFTMSEPWTTLLLDDTRVIHETTPIQPEDDSVVGRAAGMRDTLVLTYRADGFQGDA